MNILDWIKELFAKDIDLDSKISNLKASSMLQEASLSGSGDLNDLRKINKWYFINSASGILNLPPFPTLNNSAVYISGGGTGVFTQIYCANESGRLFFRRFVSWNTPQWGVWKEIATTETTFQKPALINDLTTSLNSETLRLNGNYSSVFTDQPLSGRVVLSVHEVSATFVLQQIWGGSNGYAFRVVARTGDVSGVKWNMAAITDKIDISLTLLNSYTGTASARKSVNNVDLNLNLDTTSAVKTAYTVIATLPIDFRPTVQKRFIIENGNGNYRAIIVQTNGNVIVGDTAFLAGWAIATLNWIV